MEKEEQKNIEEIDYSDWTQATREDLNVLRIKTDPDEVIVPIDPVKKKFITLWIRELPIDEQLKLLEVFFAFDSKTGDAKLKWLAYYRNCYIKMVKKSEPNIPWKEARFFNKKFMKVLMKYLPNPLDLSDSQIGGISEKTAKN